MTRACPRLKQFEKLNFDVQRRREVTYPRMRRCASASLHKTSLEPPYRFRQLEAGSAFLGHAPSFAASQRGLPRPFPRSGR